MSGWEIQWGSKHFPVEMKKLLPSDSCEELEIYEAQCHSFPYRIRNPEVALTGFGLDEDEAILDLHRDIRRRGT